MTGVPGWGASLVSQSRAHSLQREEAEKDRALRKKLADRQMNQQLGLALAQMAAKFGGQALQQGVSNYRDDRLTQVKAGVWPGQNEEVTRGDYVEDALGRGASAKALGLTPYGAAQAPLAASPPGGPPSSQTPQAYRQQQWEQEEADTTLHRESARRQADIGRRNSSTDPRVLPGGQEAAENMRGAQSFKPPNPQPVRAPVGDELLLRDHTSRFGPRVHVRAPQGATDIRSQVRRGRDDSLSYDPASQLMEAMSRMGRSGVTGQGRPAAPVGPVDRRAPSSTFAPPSTLPTRPLATTDPRSITAPPMEAYARKLQHFRQRPTDGPAPAYPARWTPMDRAMWENQSNPDLDGMSSEQRYDAVAKMVDAQPGAQQRPPDAMTPANRPAPVTAGSRLPDAEMQQMYRDELALGEASPDGDLTPGSRLPDAEMQQMYRDELALGEASPDGDLTPGSRLPDAEMQQMYRDELALGEASPDGDLTPGSRLPDAEMQQMYRDELALGEASPDGDLGSIPALTPSAPAREEPMMTMAEHRGLKMDPWLRMSLDNRRAADEKRYELSQQAARDERRVQVGEGSLRRQEAADQQSVKKWNAEQRTLLLDNSYKTTKGVSEWMAKAAPGDPRTVEQARTIARAAQGRIGYATQRGSLKALHGSIIEDEKGNRRRVTPAEVDALLRELGYDRAEVQRLKEAYADGRDAPIEVPMAEDVYNRMPELANLKTRRSAGSARTHFILPRPAPVGGDALNLDTVKFDWKNPDKALAQLNETMPNYIGAGGTAEEKQLVVAQQQQAKTGLTMYKQGLAIASKKGATPTDVQLGKTLMSSGSGTANMAYEQYKHGANIDYKRRSTAQKREDEHPRNAPTAKAARIERQNEEALKKHKEELKSAGGAWARLQAEASGKWKEPPKRVDVEDVVKERLADFGGDAGLVRKYTKAITDGRPRAPSGNATAKGAYKNAYDVVQSNKQEVAKHNNAVARGTIPVFRKANPNGTLDELESTLKKLGIPFTRDSGVETIWNSSPTLKAPKLQKVPQLGPRQSSVDRPQQDFTAHFVSIRDHVKENFPPERQQGAFMRMAKAKREELERAGVMTRQQGDEFFGTSSRLA
jgi:hypothetical protein